MSGISNKQLQQDQNHSLEQVARLQAQLDQSQDHITKLEAQVAQGQDRVAHLEAQLIGSGDQDQGSDWRPKWERLRVRLQRSQNRELRQVRRSMCDSDQLKSTTEQLRVLNHMVALLHRDTEQVDTHTLRQFVFSVLTEESGSRNINCLYSSLWFC